MKVGFCGVDESVTPDQIIAISKRAPWVEWGVLFRPDKVGEPRYPSMGYVKTLCRKIQRGDVPVRLAAHLCALRVDQVLSGDPSFVQELCGLGFQRVQINATSANGVHTLAKGHVPLLLHCIKSVPCIEWILQYNDETRETWEIVLNDDDEIHNISVLFDDSLGTGVTRTDFPTPNTDVPCGYAGGIGYKNIKSILSSINDSAFTDRAPWIDMESSLRETDSNGKDIFSMSAVLKCVEEIEKTGNIINI